MPASIDDPDWMTANQVLYAVKPENKALVDQAMLTANPWMARAKIVIGDLALSTKERKEYNTDMLKFECSRQFAVGVFKSHTKPGSAADRVISRGYDLGDFRIMYFDWLTYYEGLCHC